MKKKKDETLVEFQIGDLVPIGLALIVSGLILAYGLSIVSDTRNSGVQKCDNSSWTYNATSGGCCDPVKCVTAETGTSAAYNGTRSIGESLANITTKIPTIATIVIAAIVIGILLKYFGGMGRKE